MMDIENLDRPIQEHYAVEGFEKPKVEKTFTNRELVEALASAISAHIRDERAAHRFKERYVSGVLPLFELLDVAGAMAEIGFGRALSPKTRAAIGIGWAGMFGLIVGRQIKREAKAAAESSPYSGHGGEREDVAPWPAPLPRSESPTTYTHPMAGSFSPPVVSEMPPDQVDFISTDAGAVDVEEKPEDYVGDGAIVDGGDQGVDDGCSADDGEVRRDDSDRRGSHVSPSGDSTAGDGENDSGK